MKKRILRNKKGFTLIELIATVAIMAILAAVAVPSVYYATSKRQKKAAEYDTQQLYRYAVSCISDLASLYQTPLKPILGQSTYNYDEDGIKVFDQQQIVGEATSENGWYVAYSRELALRMYNSVGLDIEIYYFDSFEYPAASSLVGASGMGKHFSERSTFITAGNKKPYIVIQVVKYVADGVANDYLIMSYHNEKNQFAAKVTGTGNNIRAAVSLDAPTGCYQNNKNEDIYYIYKIRKG